MQKYITTKILEDKTMSKLYTEEMFLIAAEKCEVSMIDAKHIMQYIDEYVTPIQLPTDEEIYELAKEQYPISMEKFGNEMMDGNIYFRSIFIQGVEWMRDKIQGGNNE